MYLRGKKPPLKNDLFHKIHQSARFWKLTILLSGKFLQNFHQLKPISNISRKNWFLRLRKCKNNIDALPQKGILIFTLVLFWDNGRFPPPLYQNCSWFGGKFQIDQSEGRTSLKNKTNCGRIRPVFGCLKKWPKQSEIWTN